MVYDEVTGSIRKPDFDTEPERLFRSASFSSSPLFINTASFFAKGRNNEATSGALTAFNIETLPFGLSNGAIFSFRTGLHRCVYISTQITLY